MNFFVTGTDTGVGKTWVSCLLIRALRALQIDCVGMKPIETGGGNDAQALFESAGVSAPFGDINPVRLAPPAAPQLAAELTGKSIACEAILDSYRRLSSSYTSVIVEGAGGWLVPVAPHVLMADIAVEMSANAPLQVLLVVPNRLGAINHALLTVESIRARRLPCAGFILNSAFPDTHPAVGSANARLISSHSSLPLCLEVLSGQTSLDLSHPWMRNFHFLAASSQLQDLLE